jgi:hypothetical protein
MIGNGPDLAEESIQRELDFPGFPWIDPNRHVSGQTAGPIPHPFMWEKVGICGKTGFFEGIWVVFPTLASKFPDKGRSLTRYANPSPHNLKNPGARIQEPEAGA